MKKHFKVPKTIPLFHGEKRIKLGNAGGMLMWYRRDLGSLLINVKTYEQPVKCVAVKLGHTHRSYSQKPGCLLFIPPTPSKGKRADRANPEQFR